MKMKQKNRRISKIFSLMLSFALFLSGIGVLPAGGISAKASEAISIATAAELSKIGKDSKYPMDGDYVLTKDIDLSSFGNWTPIGGASGPQYALVEGDRVFSGTFDGAGHVIDGLTISYDGSSSGQSTNVSGLFAMIGSDSPSDYAEVKNINFTNVSIAHTLGRGDTIGTLSGDVNGYAKVSNIAVLSGSITVHNNGGDLIGAGSIVGQTRNNSAAVEMSHLYNAASITVDPSVANLQERCGGIIGRIHQSGTIGALTSCVNIGEVSFKGRVGYAINGFSNTADSAANTVNISNCYYIEGRGKDFGSSKAVTEDQLSSQETVEALGSDFWKIHNGRLMPIISEGKVVIPIPSPQFAQGDSASSVTKDFTLPLSFLSEEGEEAIVWTSSVPDVISIDGVTGLATVQNVLADTEVTLTGTSSVSKRTKTISVTVRSDLTVSVDQEYAKPGVTMTASVSGAPLETAFSYIWKVSGTASHGSVQSSETVSRTASYMPKESDLNKWITVTASLNGSVVGEKNIYCSKLPVVYIDTEDGYGITSKTQYKNATMRVQGNDEFNSATTTLYDGATQIRGRGNSTWNTSFSKLPYKLKLDVKTDLFGFGASKHWALLANYMDESLIRNTTSYDLAGTMGITPYLKSTHVELILNGIYAGNYQLVGNVRVDKSRVNIYNWEDLAEDAAKAIGKKEGISGDARDALEDYLNEHMQWITSDTVTYQDKTYKISDYFTDIPKNEDGSVNVSGGFLFELDQYYDEVSKFRTDYGQPMMFKTPEFVYTNPELFNSAKDFIQAVENSVHAADFYADYDGGRKHYTDLVDMDSLVRYLILNEFYWNTETMKKSTYMYKDLDSKMYIGPVWDMDWTSNSIVSSGETSNYRVWMVLTARMGSQDESWYRYLIGDPYFVQRMYECYHENRQNFEDIVKAGGVIDKDVAYLKESAQANYNAGYMQHYSPFETETERLRTFLKNRLNWMDQQFTSLQTLLNSLGKYSASSQVSVTADTSKANSTVYTASIRNSLAQKAGFYINGILAGTADVSGGKAVFTASDSYLRREPGAVNIVQVRGLDSYGELLSDGSVNNYTSFSKEVLAEALTGTVTIQGAAQVGSLLQVKVTDSNYTGTLSYQWLANGKAIAGANSDSYLLTEEEAGKQITVEVTCSVETGKLVSEATEAVVKVEVKNDHILIHQVYGGGANDGTPVSHSFIELYNPTDSEISLSGYSIGYVSGGKNGPAAEEVKLPLSGKAIPAHTSYLIRCEAQDDSTPELITLRISKFDQEWTQSIDNKRYRLILYAGDKIVDGVSVNEGNVEGQALADGAISKQKAIRRKEFADTNNNQADFETISYQGADEAKVAQYRPRSLSDGAWGTGSQNPDDDILKKEYQIYPVPQSLAYQNAALTIPKEVNVVFEQGIDAATKNRLNDILSAKGITVKEAAEKEEGAVNIAVGIAGSQGAAASYAKESLSYDNALFTKTDAYLLAVQSNQITIVGKDTDAAFYAMASLKMILEQSEGTVIRQLQIEDFADGQYRGFIEGYYGIPWSVEDRISLMEFGGDFKMNTYIFAPKDDPYHNSKWRELYPKEELVKIREMVEAGTASKCHFVWAIHPFMNSGINLSNYDSSLEVIKAKFQQLYDAGVRQFVISADDAASNTEVQVKLLNDMSAWVKSKGDCYNLVFVPMIYCTAAANWGYGISLKDYYNALKQVDEDVAFMWTGEWVCHPVSQYTIDNFSNISGREPFMWLNWPVNDVNHARLVMGPAENCILNTGGVTGFQGIVTNPLEQAEASKTSLFAIADYAWNAADFDAEKSWADGFAYIDPGASDSLHELCKHMTNPSPGGITGMAESTEISPYISEFREAFRNGNDLTKSGAALIQQFEKIVKAADDFLANGVNENLKDEMKPWVNALRNTSEAGAAYVKTAMAFNARNHNTAVAEYIKAENANKASKNCPAPQLNDATIMAQSGAMVLMPFVEEMNTSLKDDMHKLLEHEFNNNSGILNPDGKPTLIYEGLGGFYSGSADNITDGDLSTSAWFNQNPTVGAYIGLDLGKDCIINRVNIYQGNNDTHGDIFDNAVLEYSLDGKNYTEIEQIERTNNIIRDYTDRMITARYIRLRNTADTSKWYAIREFSVSTSPARLDVYTNSDALKGMQAVMGNNTMSMQVGEAGIDLTLKDGEYIGISFPAIREVTSVTADYPANSNLTLEASLDGIEWKNINTGAQKTDMSSIRLRNQGKSDLSFHLNAFTMEYSDRDVRCISTVECEKGHEPAMLMDDSLTTSFRAKGGSGAGSLTWRISQPKQVGSVYILAYPGTVEKANVSLQNEKGEWIEKKALVDGLNKITDLEQYNIIKAVKVDWEASAPEIVEMYTTEPEKTGITLSEDSVDLQIGNTVTLEARVVALAGEDRTVVWSSDRADIAQVDANGVVTALKVGTAVISASAANGKYTAECTVTVTKTGNPVKLTVTNVTAGSEEIDNGNSSEGSAELAIDGKDNTIWHSLWDGDEIENLWIMADLGEIKDVAYFNYLPRQSGSNGNILDYELFVSQDGEEWTKAVAGTWENNNSLKKAEMIAPVPARYVRLNAVTSFSDNEKQFASAAEISVYGHEHDSDLVDKRYIIDAALSADIDAEKYTEKSYQNYLKAKEQALKIAKNLEATQSEVDQAVIEYQNAIHSLAVKVTNILVQPTELNLTAGSAAKLNVTVFPEDASDKNVSFTSDDPDIVSVDKDGNVSAKRAGTAVITVTGADGAKAICTVEVTRLPVSVTGVTIQGSPVEAMEIGSQFTVRAVVQPEDADNKNVSWKSGNPSVATVKDGTITAVAAGEAVITVTTEDGSFQDSFTVKVNPPKTVAVTGLSLSGMPTDAICIGDTVTLTAKVQPENADNQNVTWKSGSPSVATVKNGVVTAVAAGETVITATTEDGGYSKECHIKVYDPKVPGFLPIKEVTAGSEETEKASATEGSVSLAIDGNDNTIWHSLFAGDKTENLWICTDLGEIKDVSFLMYLPRQDSSNNGTILKYTLTVSQDGKNWTVAAAGTWEESKELKTADIAAPIPARYVRLNAVTSSSDNAKQFASAAEIGVFGFVHDESRVDKRYVIDAALSDVIEKGNYTEESYQNYLKAKEETKKQMNNEKATQQEVDQAVKDYEDAVKGLSMKVTEIKVQPSELKLMAGSQAKLSVTVLPEDAGDKHVSFTSDHPEIASVDESGVVRALSAGKARITVTGADGAKAVCSVEVTAQPVLATGVTIHPAPPESVEIGSQFTVQAVVWPYNADNKNVIWTSNNPMVATVENGTVTAVGAGEAMIIVTTEDGGYTNSFLLNVTEKQEATKPDVPEQKPSEPVISAGQTYVVSGAKFKVISNSKNGGTVAYAGYQGDRKKTVTIPKTVRIKEKTYKVTSVASKALYNKKYVKTVKVGDNIISIGSSAFAGCTSLQNVMLGKNVKTIGTGAFSGDRKLSKLQIKSKNLRKVEKNALSKVKRVTITVPKSKKTAYDKLFKKKGAVKYKIKAK